ncbi:hypothetical protein E8E13_003026 [Curvularia kusanoi]|uniref:AAA+ ATPase domain-containing protein n=1 Tax=Curvularia kusanoi TaxID=90978 RepID=A0A9P4T898_CURKU|nr:hypothetical protein E8E13_003026 [Curvularia kusanoi]
MTHNKRMERQRSARLVQRMIRYQSPQYPSMALPYSYLTWRNMPDGQLVAAELLDSANIKWLGVCQGFSKGMTIEEFDKALLQVHRKMRGAQAWAGNNHNDKWAKFPKHVREILRKIDGEKEGFRYEKRLLRCIADSMSDEGARSLIVEQEIETRVNQLITHHYNMKQSSEASTYSSYGILKREHSVGMLLYGPPGTGKTQLARVLTQKINSIVINVSPADLRSKWCGQTGLQMKALFNLAKLIAPSIIFIDEADGLFKSRSDGNSSFYKESTEQLLVELDGVGDMDPAVIRRVPHTTYMGHPSLELREKIFDLMLEDEVVQGIDSKLLAEWTPNYTGSDIKTLCTQAALACETHVREGHDEGKRILTLELFARTLGTARPSTQEKSMKPVKAFAKQYDSETFKRLQKRWTTDDSGSGHEGDVMDYTL